MSANRETILGAWVDGPRWMGLPGYIRRSAAANGVRLVRLEVTKRWFYVTVQYTAIGPYNKILAFRKQINAGFKMFGALKQG